MLHDNSWNCLLKDMIDVTPTLGSIHPFVPKFLNAAMSSSFVRALTFDSRYNFSSSQTFSIRFRSGLSGGVRHQLMPCLSKKAWARLDVCLGSLSCIKWWFGKVSLMKGIECPQECCSTDQPALFLQKYRFSWHHSCWYQPKHEP